MEIELDIEALEKDIQRVFKKIPSTTTDTLSAIFIIQTLDEAFEKVAGRKLSTKY